eukprot:UN29686
MGVNDDMHVDCSKPGATFLNCLWALFCKKTGIEPEDVWDDDVETTLWNAKIFPIMDSNHCPERNYIIWMQELSNVTPKLVKQWRSYPRVSFADCVQLIDPKAQFMRRRSLWTSIAWKHMLVRINSHQYQKDYEQWAQNIIQDEHSNIRNEFLGQLELSLRKGLKKKDVEVINNVHTLIITTLNALCRNKKAP